MVPRLATGPVSWGVDFADDPANPPWERVLDGIAATGLGLTELGPLGYLPRPASRLRAELERRQLAVAGSFVFESFDRWSPRTLDVTRATCELIAGVGGTHVVLIQAVTDARSATAGDPGRAPRLDRSATEALLDGLAAAARIATDEFDLRPVVHNHAGTAIEFLDELDHVLASIPAGQLGLCLDTGHAAYAGLDVQALLDRWGDRLEYLHLKDVRADQLKRAIRRRDGFWRAVADGVFCPLGEGSVDFESLFARLPAVGFDGPVTIEQDRRGIDRAPEEDVIASVRYLEGLGAVAVEGRA
jgi:inosose dehydratase